MPTIGNPRKTIRIADEDLLRWAEVKAEKDGTDFTTVVIAALYRLREGEDSKFREMREAMRKAAAAS